ncbi:thyroid transcription factor 1-associated protein 26 [Tribolium castaneum]|uniref:Uncharacterized protein n=1 Tax=Tribolium castaneum TaxID=7070 RepID=D6WTW4_TRICA|nr:PREDICTED: thyroid transcription factor 1-associated protein 26 [Tribolium castaneum]EFA07318.1 hypothetical protein TcasGA2_TC015911 [Tribolium castaneum]|eukprot:XP_015836788.1 PREDICTED: thyroid transcription factor 1-associated protein 26 [Tribolium castaneum]
MAKNKVTRDRGQKTGDNFFRKTSKVGIKPSTSGEGSAKKKAFNKSKWRAEKYSFKKKLEKWNDKRTEYIRHGYCKEQNREKNQFDVNKIYEEEERREKGEANEEVIEQESGPKRRRKSFKERMQEERDEKEAKRAEFLRKKAEKEEALRKYHKEKLEKFKKLNKKTKKGQPVMKGRIEYLLEKIQRSVSASAT